MPNDRAVLEVAGQPAADAQQLLAAVAQRAAHHAGADGEAGRRDRRPGAASSTIRGRARESTRVPSCRAASARRMPSSTAATAGDVGDVGAEARREHVRSPAPRRRRATEQRNSVNVAVMSVPPKAALAHGSGIIRRSTPCAEPERGAVAPAQEQARARARRAGHVRQVHHRSRRSRRARANRRSPAARCADVATRRSAAYASVMVAVPAAAGEHAADRPGNGHGASLGLLGGGNLIPFG